MEPTLESFRIAKSGDVRTSLNPAPAAALPDELLQLTDVCVPNESETEMLTGASVQSLAEAENAAHQLLARGVQTVVLTLGERGTLLVEKDTVEYVPSVKVNAVDPTGAGAAFIGSLAVFIGEGLVLREAVKRANVIAAPSVTRIDTQVSFPNREEPEAFCNQYVLRY